MESNGGSQYARPMSWFVPWPGLLPPAPIPVNVLSRQSHCNSAAVSATADVLLGFCRLLGVAVVEALGEEADHLSMIGAG